MMDFITHSGPYYKEFCHLRVTTQLVLPIKVSVGTLMRVRVNGLFNLASELGWILWLRIWQFHFHTLRKWWFYTCWLSPCVKRLFHHCQRQMPWTPSCHTELLQRSLITTDKPDRETSIHWCAVFCKVYQSSNMCLYRRYCFHPQQQVSP